MTWRDEAACRNTETSVFFPDIYDAETVAAAVAVCEPCPVRQDCYDYASVAGPVAGIWAGGEWIVKGSGQGSRNKVVTKEEFGL